MLLCGGPALHLFSATELERLVCGNPILDFKELQANARYEAGYSADHRVSSPPLKHCHHPSMNGFTHLPDRAIAIRHEYTIDRMDAVDVELSESLIHTE